MAALQLLKEPQAAPIALEQPLGSVPHIVVRAFCETAEVTAAVNGCAADRRLGRADTTVSTGGIIAALALCKAGPSPNLLVLESRANRATLLLQLAELSAVCDAGTRVILIGAVNDVALYRDLMESGVSDYLVAPVTTNDLTATILRLFHTAGTAQLGKVCAFIGASGGVGSSTIAQNVAGTIASEFGVAVMLADLDLQFGSVALNLNLEPTSGFIEQLSDPARLDEALLDRLLVTRGKNLNVLSGSLANEVSFAEPSLPALDKLIHLAQASFPFVILDLRHGWSPWVHRALTLADEVVLTVQPDLGNLRNARMMLNTLARLRPNDLAAHLVLNQIKVPKRAEIKPAAILKALQVPGMTEIAFDTSSFSKAANSGLLMVESSPKAAACRAFGQLAAKLGGARHAVRKPMGMSRLWRR